MAVSRMAYRHPAPGAKKIQNARCKMRRRHPAREGIRGRWRGTIGKMTQEKIDDARLRLLQAHELICCAIRELCTFDPDAVKCQAYVDMAMEVLPVFCIGGKDSAME